MRAFIDFGDLLELLQELWLLNGWLLAFTFFWSWLLICQRKSFRATVI
jgi:hypothetical protein